MLNRKALIRRLEIFSIFSNLLNQNLQNVKTPKRKIGNFVQRYSYIIYGIIIHGMSGRSVVSHLGLNR